MQITMDYFNNLLLYIKEERKWTEKKTTGQTVELILEWRFFGRLPVEG